MTTVLESAATAWRLVTDERPSAQEQMAVDLALAQAAEPAFRLFRWARPAYSLGYRQPAPDWLDADRCRAARIDLVERPTGGGLAIHGTDLSCSAVLPHDAEIGLHPFMARLCAVFQAACQASGAATEWQDEPASTSGRVTYCLAQPSSYAMLAGGRKLMGFAMRRLPSAWLIQGSLLLRPIPPALSALMPESVRNLFAARSISLEAAGGQRIEHDAIVRAIITSWRQLTDEFEVRSSKFEGSSHWTALRTPNPELRTVVR